ncbi:MAG: GNAT family N-acetyltransferase [Proteobacteria bacterium]|nr:GNAT family N-acetyltransferase [Pseudomonadota bacterium]
MFIDPFLPVQTTRLTLRCVDVGDAAATSALMTPEVSRWLANWPLPFGIESALARIETMRRCASDGDAIPLAMIETVSGTLVGWITLARDGTRRRRGSLGYWLGQEYHGRGYMKEAVPAALQAGFALLDLDVIEAAAQLTNIGSFAIMRACGMKPVTTAMAHAPARNREELCCLYEIARMSSTI